MFYLIIAASGITAKPELLGSRGRIDMAVELSGQAFVMEFKCDQSPQVALEQIRTRGYAERYHDSDRRVFLIGIEFSKTERNVAAWDVVGPL